MKPQILKFCKCSPRIEVDFEEMDDVCIPPIRSFGDGLIEKGILECFEIDMLGCGSIRERLKIDVDHWLRRMKSLRPIIVFVIRYRFLPAEDFLNHETLANV